MWGGRGGEGGEAGEHQIRAPGNPYFSFSSSSFSLCIRRGFDKNSVLGSAVQAQCVCQLIEVGHDNGGKFATSVQDTSGKLDCLHQKVNLKKKIVSIC